jgi:hypothetical protein
MASAALQRALRRQTIQLRNALHRRPQSTKHAEPKRPEDPIPVPNTVSPLPLWQRLGPLTRAAEGYARAQRKRPYVTQLCSSLVIYFCGDAAAQRIGGEDYDPARTGRALTIGAISSIPSFHWFVPFPGPSCELLLTATG